MRPVKLPVRLSKKIPLTHDSAELRFELIEGDIPSYLPGQFMNLAIETPRSSSSWELLTHAHIFAYLKTVEQATQEEILSHFPVLDEKALRGMIGRLLRYEAITQEDDAYAVAKEELPEIPAPPFMRAYSLASIPGDTYLSTMVKKMPGGCMSEFLVDVIEEGDTGVLMGPFGHFAYSGNGDVLLIGAGSGLTPLMSILRSIAAGEGEQKATLLYSNKTPEDIIYHQELEDLTADKDALKVVHTITRPDTSSTVWDGRVGRIDTALLKEHLDTMEEATIYICGPLQFGKSMKELLLDLGVQEDMIKLEAYG